MKKLYYILASALLTGCSAEEIQNVIGSGDAVEITGFRTVVDNGSEVSRAVSRAAALTDTVGRLDFVANDIILFTNIQRTANANATFTYPHDEEVIDMKRTDQTSWERVSAVPERIYWTDASSPHTFKGYGCPQGANTPEGFDWNKGNVDSERFYAYFGSLGNPTLSQTTTEGVTTNFIDYTNDSDDTQDENSKKYYSGNSKICNDDILLAYNTAQQADPGGQVATIHFYHGLSCVRVVVNISGFAASATSEDSKSKVDKLDLLDMRTMYKWDQQSHNCTELIEGDQIYLDGFYANPGDGKSVPTWDQTKNIRCWIPNPDGVGNGTTKTFTFYGLAVPTTGKNQQIRFNVTYPDPMNPNTNITRSYTAEISNLEYRAGHCTTINITLNHQNDKMTVGAEYQDWQFIETPDQGMLKKNSTFLSYIPTNETDRIAKKIYIAYDTQATADDATWLYKDGSDIKDIYGNTGTEAAPYTISTANQLLSFAYEVKSGRGFEGKYVKLDADITLQAKSELPTTTNAENQTVVDVSKLVNWIGIGDATHKFNGVFNGNFRHINRLYGKPLFNSIGSNGIVDHIFISDAVEISGSGSIAETNDGIICGSHVEGDIVDKAYVPFCGSIVGVNNGVLIACSHIGSITGNANILGALLGKNDGILVTCYNVGDAKNNAPGRPAYAGVGAFTSRSVAYCCYFNKDFYTAQDYSDLQSNIGHVAFPLTTSEMQSNKYVNQARVEDPVTHELSGEITDVRHKDDPFYYHWSMNAGLSRAVDFLNDALGKTPDTQDYVYFHAPGTNDDTNPIDNRVTLKKTQVEWLVNHFDNESHQFQFIPGTYPKLK